MNIRALLVFVASLAGGIAAARAADAPQDFTAAKATAVADEASLDAPAKTALEQAQRTLIDAGTQGCATDKPDFAPFVVVMELNADGEVARTWRQGESLLSICMEHAMRGKRLVVPPRAPFYSLIEISFSK